MTTNSTDLARLDNIPGWKRPLCTALSTEDISLSLRKLLETRIRSHLRIEEQEASSTTDRDGRHPEAPVPQLGADKGEGIVAPFGQGCGNAAWLPDPVRGESASARKSVAYSTVSESIEQEAQMAALVRIEKKIKELEAHLKVLGEERRALLTGHSETLMKSEEYGEIKNSTEAWMKQNAGARHMIVCNANNAPASSVANLKPETANSDPELAIQSFSSKGHSTPSRGVSLASGSPSYLAVNYQPSPYSKAGLRTFIDRGSHAPLDDSTRRSFSPFPPHDALHGVPFTRKRSCGTFPTRNGMSNGRGDSYGNYSSGCRTNKNSSNYSSKNGGPPLNSGYPRHRHMQHANCDRASPASDSRGQSSAYASRSGVNANKGYAGDFESSRR